ncbi:MAG: hypothetical protein M1828_005410 [Chrysothrix sp. TS-e1954]|nr:MAG: hypothetical protein M1828_005410 [Chrysothrix sp. TS-e1954]
MCITYLLYRCFGNKNKNQGQSGAQGQALMLGAMLLLAGSAAASSSPMESEQALVSRGSGLMVGGAEPMLLRGGVGGEGDVLETLGI